MGEKQESPARLVSAFPAPEKLPELQGAANGRSGLTLRLDAGTQPRPGPGAQGSRQAGQPEMTENCLVEAPSSLSGWGEGWLLGAPLPTAEGNVVTTEDK